MLTWSMLPTLRCPILLVHRLLVFWFANSMAPSINNMANVLGVSGNLGSCAQKLAKRLLVAESECAIARQKKRKLRGLIECDGTSIRSYKIAGTQNLAYVQLYGAIERTSRKVNLYQLGIAVSKNLGKPPPESWAKISATSFLTDVEKTDAAGKTSCIISDGAKVYPKIAKTLKILNRSVSHATREFQRTDKLHASKVSVHTGSIDQAWKDLKKNVPNSIATRKDGAPNPLLWQYATQWQWRWENSANLSRLTAETLRANMQ